jgi:UMF1 family MFS transporter
MGYVGSVLLLLINLAMVMQPDLFDITGTKGEAAMKAMRYSFVMVGVWWVLFSQYTFYFLPKGNHKATQKMTSSVIYNGFRELKKVWEQLHTLPILKGYLGAYFVYSMAVQTVMLIATYFGAQEILWANESEKTMGLIVCILVIQLVAIAGAQLTSKASKRFGNLPTLLVINCFWLLLCILAYFITLPIHFYAMAGLVGIVMGGIQSLSRSTYSKLLPETEDTASYFSFFDVAEKVGIVIGMCVYGIIDQITGSPRFSIVFLGLFFFVGIILLNRVRIKAKQIAP